MSSHRKQLSTKDDVPLYELGDFTLDMMDVFNEEASRGFIDMVSQEVDSRTWLARTGDMTWEEVAEIEHARTGDLQDYQMAFSVDTYARDLGFSREYIEDSPAEVIRDHVTELIAGGRDKMFEVVFDVMKNGIADGSQLWYDPQDYGDYTFSRTHDHTYTGLNTDSADTSNTLFSDASSRTPTEVMNELVKDLRHHGYDPDVALMPDDMADLFIEERSDGFGSQYYVPQAENLESSTLEDATDTLTVRGVDLMETAWITPDTNDEYPLYVYDSSAAPVKTNTVREMEVTDNTGAPVGGAGGFRGDPGALLGTYGSMRMGAKFADPLAGATVNVTPSEITTS